ncbi:disease resistance protein PIK6-NP-like, partial [Triticum dicoccoides]|uniref:disease resistance protein PIK6-NP-like n=1 Tax=Triticum dicoccoides TaxID=85692 RepID=UPI0018907EFF
QYDDNSTVIVTPVIQQSVQFHGWYLASWLFLLSASRYKVHFYSHIEALSKKANELLVGGHESEELKSNVKRILEKCRWDSFSTGLFLHALYANPRRSNNELVALQHRLQDFNTVSNAREIIRFCYDDLPSQYKSCLHYLSMFHGPHYSNIRRASLLRRWAAENLITTRHALDEAERGFNALVDRGLVLLGGISPTGKAKTCRVHPHVLSFITNMACEDYVGNTDLLPADLAPRLSIRNRMQLQQLSNQQQATHFNMCQRIPRRTTPTQEKNSKDPLPDIVMFLNSLPASSQLGLIKVLDLEGCHGLDKQKLKNMCNKIFQLKYLSLRNTDVKELPKEIGKLQHLETFDMRGNKIKSFPVNVVLQKLVHLLAGHKHLMDQAASATGSNESFCNLQMPHGIRSMTNIQVLSHVEVSDVKELDVVGQLQQLRKLGVIIPCNNPDVITHLLRVTGKLDEYLSSLSVHMEVAEADVDLDTKDQDISHPRSLQSLNIDGKIARLPTWIKKLHRLSKIVLCRTSLKADDIELVLGKLLRLHTVVLRYDSYKDNKLNFKEKRFGQLELLVIDGSDITKINFDPAAAPKLERIVWTSTSSSKAD